MLRPLPASSPSSPKGTNHRLRPSIFNSKESIKEALEENTIVDAGGKANSTKNSRDEYPDTEMKEAALFMFAELGRAPSMEEWNANPNTCSAGILERRHGSYNKAMLAYGITPIYEGCSHYVANGLPTYSFFHSHH